MITNMPIDAFIEEVIVDNHGQHVTQSMIHQIWQAHIDWCICNNRFCGIVAPWGHGKTEQIVIGRTLHFFGMDNNLRIKIICNTDENAVDRVTSIKRYIEDDENYKEICPNVKPSKKISQKFRKRGDQRFYQSMPEKWSGHKIVLDRAGRGKDSSLEAWGVMSSGVGTRADIIIVDDPVDMRNAINEPGMRAKVINTFESVWLGRLEPEGVLIYVATVWHEHDLTNHLMKNPLYSFIFMGVSNDMTHIEMKLINCSTTHPCYTGEDIIKIPLWKEKWSREELVDRRCKTGEASFARGYRNIPWNDTDLLFKHFDDCLDCDTSVEEWVEHAKKKQIAGRQVSFAVGVDLSGAKRPGNVVFVAGTIEGENKIVPVDIRTGNWTSPQLADVIKDVYMTWKPTIIYVENVALQEMLLEWIRLQMEQGRFIPMPIEGFMTGKQKSDPLVGLPGMEVEFKNKMWQICWKSFDSHDKESCLCEWCRWRKTMKQYPFSGDTDIVMSSWFTREAMRKYCGIGSMMMTAADYREVMQSNTGISSKSAEKLEQYIDNMFNAPAGVMSTAGFQGYSW